MAGRRLGRYELVAELGTGGIATVWLARASGPGNFDRLVAIKRIHPHLLRDPRVVAMFAEEARVAASVRHPNVCPVFDFGYAEGSFYTVMEYLEGQPWARLFDVLHVRSRDLPAAERHAFVARIVADAAEGLHAAHEARTSGGEPLEVVHRDVAPANLFLRWDGVVQVTDFGCAHARGRLLCSDLGDARGRAAYAAPEVLRGRTPDRRADVWSLGVVLWELLTGARLFERASVHDTLFAVVEGHVPPPGRLAPGVPEALEQIAVRAIQVDPNARHASAQELARDLRSFVRASGVPMEVADVARWAEHVFPGGRQRTAVLLDRAKKPLPAVAPTAEPAPGAPRAALAAAASTIRAHPVLAAVAIGLCLGLVGTWTFVALARQSAAAAITSVDDGELPGAPRAVDVPVEEEQVQPPGETCPLSGSGDPECK